jgi:hypothetical protein
MKPQGKFERNMQLWLLSLAAAILFAATNVPTVVAATPDLSGTYTADDGGIYYLQQSGNVLWWVGMSLDTNPTPDLQWHRGLAYTSVFRGTINGDGTITGQWADVSRGVLLPSGTVTLAVATANGVPQLAMVSETGSSGGGFPAVLWTWTQPLDDTQINGNTVDIISRFNAVHKNDADGSSTLGDDNLKAYRDQTVMYGRIADAYLNSSQSLEDSLPHIGYGPDTWGIPGYPDFSQPARDFTTFTCWSSNGEDGDIDMNLNVDTSQMEPDFYTTGWGNRDSGPSVYSLKLNAASVQNKLHYGAFLHAEAIMYGKAANCSTPQDATYGTASLLPGWADIYSSSVLVNGRPANGSLTGGNCGFIQPCPFLGGADKTNYLVSPIGIGLRDQLLSAYGDGKVNSDGSVGQGAGTYVRLTGALVLDCGHFSYSLDDWGHTCDDDLDDPDQVSGNQNQEIHPIYSIDVINYPFRPEDATVTARSNLTGTWGGSDGSTYYLRQIGNTIWWLGMPRDRQPLQRGPDDYPSIDSLQFAAALRAGTAPIDYNANCGPGTAIWGVLLGAAYPCWVFANVFQGTITNQTDGTAIIQGDWAGVPQSISPGNAGSSQAFTLDTTRKLIQPISSAPTIFPTTLQKLYEPEDTTPPSSTLTWGNPHYLAFVTSATPFSIAVTDTESGVQNIWQRYYLDGSNAPVYSPTIGSSTSFALTGTDGLYDVGWYATDNAGNDEPPQLEQVYLDNTAPQISISQPIAGQYPHSGTLVLSYSVSDQGSGVKNIAPKLDGAATLSGHGLLSGQSINLLTELSLGMHTFSVNGVDNLNNTGTQTVTFSVVVTADSIKGDVTQFLQNGAIDNSGVANSLLSTLSAAASARGRGACSTSANIYQAFINELQALSGKHVSASAAAIMIADAQYLIVNCP